MIEKILKIVKSSNKKRGRNITVGAVVGMLLSCTAVMGADNYLWIKEDNRGVKFNTTITTDTSEANGNWNEGNPYEENEWNGSTYINNTVLSSSTFNVKNSWGNNDNYALKLSGDLSGKSFINNASIATVGGKETSMLTNYGIYTYIGGAVGNLTNNGLITVIGKDNSYSYGIYNVGTTGAITNKGSIEVIRIGNGSVYSYGISNAGTIATILNDGSIIAVGKESNGGYGIHNRKIITTMINNGLILGKGNSSSDGYGIYNSASYSEIGTINNTGVIYGKTNAIKNEIGGTITSMANYGILVTKGSIAVEGMFPVNNYGLYIEGTSEVVSVEDSNKSDAAREIVVNYGDSGTELKRNMTIKNNIATNGTGSINGDENDSILNALKNTYEVTGTNKVTGSIINAYEEAVAFNTTDKQLTLSGTIVNGGVKDNTFAVKGSTGTDTLILEGAEVQYKNIGNKFQQTVINGNIDMEAGTDTLTVGIGTIINGNIDMGDDDDTLTIEKGSIINGTLDGGTGSDILNFNSKTIRALNNDEINIVHNILNFEKININTNVTLFEKIAKANGTLENLAITGAENIIIGENGTLTLRVNTSKVDNSSGTDKVTGHALYENTGTIKSVNGGKLLLALDGAGNEKIISFGDTKLDSSLVTKPEGAGITFDTTSALHWIKKIQGTNNEIIITSKADLFVIDNIAYENLNKIYHSILSVDELGNFNVDDKKLLTFLGYLNDIYTGSPYSYSSELSRKSTGMFRDIVTENIFKPEINKWMIYGGLTHVDGGTKDTYYGKGYYTYDIGSSDMDADTKITGAYMMGEYGVSDTLISGVVIGGNKLKSDLSNGSKVDGSAMYLGAYAKKYIGNLKVTAGTGFQYGDYDADRLAVNRVASSTGEPMMKYSDNYNDMTYDIYLNGRYSHQVGDNLFLEPYGTLSYTYIKQDGADEGNKTLAIETDSKSFDYTVGKVGVDLKKVIPHEKGKSTLSAGVSYTRILDGADEEYVTGKFKGGTDFDILVAHKNQHSIGLNAKYALELENGVIFDVKGTYSVERDSHNNSGKNRTKGEWIVGAGLGYKF